MQAAVRNRLIVAEFRSNAGRLGGDFTEIPVLLLHSVDATETMRIVPLTYRPFGAALLVVASNSGAKADPAWYRDLMARPVVMVELGRNDGVENVVVRARTAVGDERVTLWAQQKRLVPRFAAYEHMTARELPVVVLDRV